MASCFRARVYSRTILVLAALIGWDFPTALGWLGARRFTVYSSPSIVLTSSLRRLGGLTMSPIDVPASNYGPPILPSSTPVRVLGVCGGIGSGKSTACKRLVLSCDCLQHIDADAVAHSVYAPGSQTVRDVVETFGSEILLRRDSDDEFYVEGGAPAKTPMEIDRKKLGAIVFADQSAMSKLEAIVWPHVRTALADQIDVLRREWAATGMQKEETEEKNDITSKNRRPIVVLEAAILLDAGWEDLCDGVWVVTVPREVAIKRLVEARGMTTEEAIKRITAQESRRGIENNLREEIDAGVVTGVIKNDGTLEDLTNSLKRLLDDPHCWKN